MTELAFEISKLIETRNKIQNEIEKNREFAQGLEEKIATYKKESKGAYNEELDIAKKIKDITDKNIVNYEDIKTKPYFARIDFREIKFEKEKLYIGKFGVDSSDSGEEIVIDWRTPIADLYYSGTEGKSYYSAPKGVIEGELSLKRKFLFDEDNSIKQIFDEGINEIILKNGTEENALVDEFLKIALERESSSKLKEVVSTIQKEQNEIIRQGKNEIIIVQGSAGSGKTTVALHRLAYLLYRYKNVLLDSKVAIMAPNKVFLDYISNVLPELGSGDVKQFTFEDFAFASLKIKDKKLISKDKKLIEIMEKGKEIEEYEFISRFKGSILFREILDKYVEYLEGCDIPEEGIKTSGYTLFTVSEISDLFLKSMKNMPIADRKRKIKKYFSLKLKSKIEDLQYTLENKYDDKILKIKMTEEATEERRIKIINIYAQRDQIKKMIKDNFKKDFTKFFDAWANVNYHDLYYKMFENKELFMELSNKQISEYEYEKIFNNLKENTENKKIDSEDIVGMLYLKIRTEGIDDNSKFQYLIVDEAQDYNYLHFHVFKFLTYSGSMTILGDIGQGIYSYRSIESWEKLLENTFDNKAKFLKLETSYRSTIEIINFANRVLEKQKNYTSSSKPVLRHGEEPEVFEYNGNKEFLNKLNEIHSKMQLLNKKKIAIIVKDSNKGKELQTYLKKHSDVKWKLIKDTENSFSEDNLIVPSYMAKGLEFDCVVVYNANESVYGDNEFDKKLLYVILTRALHFEYIGYSSNDEISDLIK